MRIAHCPLELSNAASQCGAALPGLNRLGKGIEVVLGLTCDSFLTPPQWRRANPATPEQDVCSRWLEAEFTAPIDQQWLPDTLG